MTARILLWGNRLHDIIKHHGEFKGKSRIALMGSTGKSNRGFPGDIIERKSIKNPISGFVLSFLLILYFHMHLGNSFISPLGHLCPLLPNVTHLFSWVLYLSKTEH